MVVVAPTAEGREVREAMAPQVEPEATAAMPPGIQVTAMVASVAKVVEA
jgi:hypothetical protein